MLRNSKSGLLLAATLATALLIFAAPPQSASFRFVILGDRTGEAQPGVYPQVWREAAASHPAFILSVGDTIEGLHDETAAAQWTEVSRIFAPYRRIPLYLTPGNHDVWSTVSENLYRKHSGRPLHYSFDYRQAHFTVLDNSRSDALPPPEMDFLKSDLEAHAAQPVKFIVSHRPSWLLPAALGDTHFALHELAHQYGVQFIVAGHVHQLLHAGMQSISYISMPSSGGHLRLSKKYEDGWLFGYATVEVRDNQVRIQIHETGPPHGEGRVTSIDDWGRTGLHAR